MSIKLIRLKKIYVEKDCHLLENFENQEKGTVLDVYKLFCNIYFDVKTKLLK